MDTPVGCAVIPILECIIGNRADALRALVPVSHYSVQVLADNCIFGRVDDGCVRVTLFSSAEQFRRYLMDDSPFPTSAPLWGWLRPAKSSPHSTLSPKPWCAPQHCALFSDWSNIFRLAALEQFS